MANLSMKMKDEKHLALKHLAVDKNTSVTALVDEAIDLLFAMESGKATGGSVVHKRGRVQNMPGLPTPKEAQELRGKQTKFKKENV